MRESEPKQVNQLTIVPRFYLYLSAQRAIDALKVVYCQNSGTAKIKLG
jgi:hypothetical protein